MEVLATKDRLDWDPYFMDIARVVSARSTCPRKSVGSVIVRDRAILSCGYNGSVSGLAHCSVEGCLMEDSHCVRSIHSECNAIVLAAKNGLAINKSTIYITASPCWSCFKLCVNSGIIRIVYGEFYRDDRIFSAAEKLAVELVELGGKL